MSRTRQGTRQELGACACLPCPGTDQRVRLHFLSELTCIVCWCLVCPVWFPIFKYLYLFKKEVRWMRDRNTNERDLLLGAEPTAVTRNPGWARAASRCVQYEGRVNHMRRLLRRPARPEDRAPTSTKSHLPAGAGAGSMGGEARGAEQPSESTVLCCCSHQAMGG